MIATDTAGLVTFMNGVAEALTGFSESEARGRPLPEVFRIFSEQTREVVESPVTKVLREGTVVGPSQPHPAPHQARRRAPDRRQRCADP